MTPAELASFFHGPPRRIHLIGVAGSGMSGIASLLLALGHEVRGSDRTETLETQRLARKGLRFETPHRASQVRDAELVIYSSAVKTGNPAYDEAMRLGLPLCRRADALAAIMAGRRGIVVSGMHGKTTTSSMAAYVLRAAGRKPSHYVGAEIPILGSNARWDSDGDLFVAEGDESDGTLVNYHPEFSIVLNVEPEHLDFYPDLDAIDAVYSTLVRQTSGRVIYCADDPGAERVTRLSPHRVSYGTHPAAHFRLTNLSTDQGRPTFDVLEYNQLLGSIHLGIPGPHNALNALAVIALARLLDIPFAPIAEALAKFEGARRRFETLYRDDEFHLVDDYGHHPSEIAVTLATARQTGASRVLVAFQPHRFTRTQALQTEFGQALQNCDFLAVTSIYPASETPIPGVTGELITTATQQAGHDQVLSEPNLRALPAVLGSRLAPGDLVLTLGAGNIHEAGRALAADLTLRREIRQVLGPGRILLHEPLAKHTTLRIGGPARFWVEPETETGFADLVRFCSDRDIPLLVLGRGSNLLIRDGGFPGVVAHLARGEFLHHSINGNEITAGVGLKFKQLAEIARKAGLSDFEWMEGIPGNLGGGLRMNAGAMGWQTFDQVVSVRFCDEEGNFFTRTPDQLEVHYRHVPSLIRNYALSATLRGTPAPPEKIAALMRASEEKRRSSQPIAASAGCIFKNPPEIPAGRLIEELGWKGRSVGAARVSPIHGNFIVNEGGASANEVLELIRAIQDDARRQRGIELQTEVQILGEDQ
jgi:UDP-N-acetylmuramate--L-alanine ligase/UDP-N-acetylenolpyruvoylglucosamine reductase